MSKVMKVIYILMASFILSSCMDLYPKGQLSDSQVWSTAENFRLFANQYYSWTRDFQGSGSVTYMNGVNEGPHSDLRSDLLCQSTVNVFSAGTNSIPSTDANYTEIYKRLYYTNLLLEKAKTFEPADEIREPVAEAYFFRAYLHFELVQMFGDCILLDKVIDLNDKKVYGERNNRLEVIQQCIEDLKAATGLLEETPSEEGRLCRYTALALLSRIALYEGTWQKYHLDDIETSGKLFLEAVQAAQAVMESKKYELFGSSQLEAGENYRYMFILEDVRCNPASLTKSDNKEYILARRHDQVLKPIGTDVTHASLNNAYYVTRKLADMYRCQDGLPIALSPLFRGYATAVSEFENRDNRMNATLLKHGQNYWDNDGKWRTSWNQEDLAVSHVANVRRNSGYANYKWASERQVTDRQESYDYPVIRYAEVLLNYAEATYEYNEAITDQQLDISLNLVRARCNPEMTPLSNRLISDNASNGMNMLEEIRAERTIELFMEGFRIDDLKRWKLAEVEMPQNLVGVQYSDTWFESNWTDQNRILDEQGRILLYDSRRWETKHYLLPLPNDEIQLNPLLGQNPNWK